MTLRSGTLRRRLEELVATRGVRSVAIASLDGLVVESAGIGIATPRAAHAGSADTDEVAGLIAESLASSRALAELFGDGELRQATIEFEQGPVLLTPLAAPAESHVAVMVLDDLADLGRARLALRRSASDLAEAAAA